MAKVTITFEDDKDGTASVVLNPDVKTLISMVKSGHELQESEKLALRAAAAIMMTPEEHKAMVAKQQAAKAGLYLPNQGLF